MSNGGKMADIEVKCRANDSLPIDRIIEFQGKLKTLTAENEGRLRASILKYGFIAPIFVWDNAGDFSVLDGHQRLKVLLKLREEGYDLPMIPVVYVEAEDEADAKRKLLQVTSQYGEFSTEGFKHFTENLDFDMEDFRLLDGEFKINLEQEENSEQKDVEVLERYDVICQFVTEEACEEFFSEMQKRGIECRLSI